MKLSRPCCLCRRITHIFALCSSASSSICEASLKVVDSFRNQLCINTSNNSFGNILPKISIDIRKGERVSVRVLLDLGSQQSYFNKSVLCKLEIEFNTLPCYSSSVKTFFGDQFRGMYIVELELTTCSKEFLEISDYRP